MDARLVKCYIHKIIGLGAYLVHRHSHALLVLGFNLKRFFNGFINRATIRWRTILFCAKSFRLHYGLVSMK